MQAAGGQQQKGQVIIEIDTDIYLRLVKAGILKQGPPKSKPVDSKKTAIDVEGSQLIESGIALAKYLVTLKESLVVSY